MVLAAGVVVGVIPLSLLLRARVPLEASAHSDSITASRAKSAGFSPRALMWLLGLAGIGCCVAMSMPQVHIVAYCVDLGYGPAVGAEMLSLMLLGGVVSRLISGLLADRLGGVMTLLIGSALQCLALFLYLPAGGLVSLYVVSLIFGLSQGGIVPSYAVIVREYMPAREAGARVGFVIMATIVGMAIGGWMSGWIYDVTGSYHMAFINGIAWTFLNIGIMLLILTRARRAMRLATADGITFAPLALAGLPCCGRAAAGVAPGLPAPAVPEGARPDAFGRGLRLAAMVLLSPGCRAWRSAGRSDLRSGRGDSRAAACGARSSSAAPGGRRNRACSVAGDR
jgi:MFS family permease